MEQMMDELLPDLLRQFQRGAKAGSAKKLPMQ
jgi:hypothetical protein